MSKDEPKVASGCCSEAQAVGRTQHGLVRRFSISDYGAAAIGEGIAFAGLCIGLGIYRADALWILVIVWFFCFGPSKSLRDKPTANPTVDPRPTGKGEKQ